MRRHRIIKHIDESENSTFDLSISDLMTGLMMLFILLLMVLMLNLQSATAKFETQQKLYTNINKEAEEYLNLRNELFEELFEEFKEDLDKWNAEIDPSNLAIRFANETNLGIDKIFFQPNSQVVEEAYKKVLKDFYPRFIKILYKEKYRDFISEVRIEGHAANPGDNFDYLTLITFSQGRTNNVLYYILSTVILDNETSQWLESRVSATGFGASHPMFTEGKIDYAKSRRVEFRIITDAETKIQEIYNFNPSTNGID